MAFGISASMAMRRAAADAQPVLLEPVMDLEVVTPEDYVGEVISDLNSKRAKIIGVDAASHYQTLKAHVPLSEMFGYSTALRSATQGRANFTMRFLEYDAVPKGKAEAIIKKIRGI
jgi:elongation factor G